MIDCLKERDIIDFVMKIKNKKLINEFIDMIVVVGEGEDGEVGLNEFMFGMYGKGWDGKSESVEKLKVDVLNEYGIKIGVNEDGECVYVLSGDE